MCQEHLGVHQRQIHEENKVKPMEEKARKDRLTSSFRQNKLVEKLEE